MVKGSQNPGAMTVTEATASFLAQTLIATFGVWVLALGFSVLSSGLRVFKVLRSTLYFSLSFFVRVIAHSYL